MTKSCTYALLLGRQRAAALNPPLLVLEVEALLLQRLLHLAMASVELLFGLLELGLLLLHLLLEDQLHLRFHLRELSFVHDALLLDTDSRANQSDQNVLRSTENVVLLT